MRFTIGYYYLHRYEVLHTTSNNPELFGRKAMFLGVEEKALDRLT
jgi:hypothetical protein